MDKVVLKDLDVAASVSAEDTLFGYSAAGNKYFQVPVSNINGDGWAGCRWAKGNASPVGEPCGSINKLRDLPDILGLGCYLVQNDHSRRKLAADNSYKFAADGATAALDGSMGHYQWGVGRDFFYAAWEYAEYEYEAIDIKPIPGVYNYHIPVFSRPAAGYSTIDRTEGRLVSFINDDGRYRGGNNNAALDSLFNSQLGKPVSNMTVEQYHAAAKLNGKMWGANPYMVTFITGAIKRIIFHNKNIQASFNGSLTTQGLRQGGTGIGVDLVSDWEGAWGFHAYIPLSAGCERGDFTGIFSHSINDNGTTKSMGNIPSFYGLKNDYKYLSPVLSHCILSNNSDKSQSVYIKPVWDGNDFNIQDLSSLQLVGRTPVVSKAAWNSSKKQNRQNLISFPLEIGGSDSTYDCDGYYNPALTSGLRVLRALGSAVTGGLAGSCYLGGGNGVGASTAYYPALLCEAKEAWDATPFMG